MISIVRTNYVNTDFISLIKELDAFLKVTDKDEYDFYNQFNNIDVLKNVIIIYIDDEPVGCGAIKKFNESSVEIKRMFVSKNQRGKGIAQKILTELEVWAAALKYKKCILETGIRQVEAVKFYKKCKYKIIPNYEQYIGMENSVCFEKLL